MLKTPSVTTMDDRVSAADRISRDPRQAVVFENCTGDLHRRDIPHVEKLGPDDTKIRLRHYVVLDQGTQRRFAAADVAGDRDKGLIFDRIQDAIDDLLERRTDVNLAARLRRVGKWIGRKAEVSLRHGRQLETLTDHGLVFSLCKDGF